MRHRAFLLAVFICLSPCLPTMPASAYAASSVPGLGDCPLYPGGDHICSGMVPSFDGSPLEVDLTLPRPGSGTHPLILMLHGFGNNKHEWESASDDGDGRDKWHWNSHWFAGHGFYVLNYTARGFVDQGPDRADQPNTPTTATGSLAPPRGLIHLKSRDVEIRDTQYLAALVAAAYPDLDTNKVAVTGGSYGGGEAWTQASQALWTSAHDLNPLLPVLQLQVAVPKYPWTDLGYSLAPNGHKGPFQQSIYASSTGSPTSNSGEGNPIGSIKYSYASGFFVEGIARGFFEVAPENIPGWYADGVQVADPYDAGMPGTDRPVYIPELRRGLTELRSSYYQDEFWAQQVNHREVAIFSVSGWTDDLFPPIESFRQFKYLKSLDPLWPVEVRVADIGHPRAQNPAWEWQRLNAQAWSFLQQQIGGSHRQQTQVASLPTVCPGWSATDGAEQGDDTQQVTGRTPESLARGVLQIDYDTPGTLTNRRPPPFPTPDPADPDNLQTDPAFGAVILHLPDCRQSIAPAAAPPARYTGYSAPLSAARTYVGLGHLHLTYTLAGANTATLNARVWDVAPDGKALLVTRGTYRIDGNFTAAGFDPLPTGTIDLPLFGNHWTLSSGHTVRLDLSQVDYPTFVSSNSLAAVISFPGVRLVLPTLQGSQTELSQPGPGEAGQQRQDGAGRQQ